MDNDNERHEHHTVYFVNGERQTTGAAELDVKAILAHAGFDPVTDYRLTRDEGNHVYTDYDQDVPIHDGERFTATYVGPTPTS
jgi:hypothetical protein